MISTVQVSPTFNLRHTALFLAGLGTQERFRLERSPSIRSDAVLWCTRNGRRVVVDLVDRADQYDEAGLAACDVYLKRSLPAASGKIKPFGLNYSARGTRSALRAAFVRRDVRTAIDLLRRAHSTAYEYPAHQPRERVVLLQTRLWNQDECPGDTAINEQRIELVASLQRAFGARFRGGLADTPLARRMAPTLVARNFKQRAYVSWQRPAQVAVYTRGLFNSMGFKMAEYLASGKCIVSEPFDTCLPTPLVDGTHLRLFRSLDECVEQCGQLLEQAGEFPANAWSYYQQHVRLAADAIQQLVQATDHPLHAVPSARE